MTRQNYYHCKQDENHGIMPIRYRRERSYKGRYNNILTNMTVVLCSSLALTLIVLMVVSSSFNSPNANIVYFANADSSHNKEKTEIEKNDDIILSSDNIVDSIYDISAMDPDCAVDNNDSNKNINNNQCFQPPNSSIEEESYYVEVEEEVEVEVEEEEDNNEDKTTRKSSEHIAKQKLICQEEDDGLCGHLGVNDDDYIENDEDFSDLKDIANAYGGKDPDEDEQLEVIDPLEEDDKNGNDSSNKKQPNKKKKKKRRLIRKSKERRTMDKHWGSDEKILKLRDTLRAAGLGGNKNPDGRLSKRPPVFLMPGLASTRLVAWSNYQCKGMGADINIQDYVWLNINKILELATIDAECWISCMSLGINQTDNKSGEGCKLRPDEGLDAISSLAPGSISTNMLVGGTNTVYAWLTHWLAENLGYDVTSMLGLPYDWRVSPDVMENRDGFFTLTRRRIEATVASNGAPGIIVAHSMGNTVFRYFLEWLRHEFRKEAYAGYLKIKKNNQNQQQRQANYPAMKRSTYYEQFLPGWVTKKYHPSHSNPASTAATTNTFTNNSPGSPKTKEDKSVENQNRIVHNLDDWWKKYVLGISDAENDDGSKDNKMNDANEDIHNSDKNEEQSTKNDEYDEMDDEKRQSEVLWELAEVEGDLAWFDWLDSHIWTYVGLSAPLLGAFGPLRSVLSGENMGLPMNDEIARRLELSFGSTHTVNSISTKMGFCDEENSTGTASKKLACLDELASGIENSGSGEDSWKDFDALRLLLKERVDFDTSFPNVRVVKEYCEKSEKSPCAKNENIDFGPRDIQNGRIFEEFDKIWNEKGRPLKVKRDQLEQSFWSTPFDNILNHTWDRPPIKHIILAYGVDVPTEIGYEYKKSEVIIPEDDNYTDINDKKSQQSNNEDEKGDNSSDEYDGIPMIQRAIWETANGKLMLESLKGSRSRLSIRATKPKMQEYQGNGKEKLPHSGDGTIPYLSLAWAHTWLLHATRAMRHSESENSLGKIGGNPLDSIKFSYRPNGGSHWISGKLRQILDDIDQGNGSVSDSDTGTSHPHGTKYKPEMRRFQSKGKSRTTGMDYTTAVIEAIGVEHKETTRNYDILAAVFTDILKYMSDDFDFVETAV